MQVEASMIELGDIYGDGFILERIENAGEQLIFHLKSNKKTSKCPFCGQESSKVHTSYTRNIQETPFRNKQTWLHVTARKFECENPSCGTKVFADCCGQSPTPRNHQAGCPIISGQVARGGEREKTPARLGRSKDKKREDYMPNQE